MKSADKSAYGSLLTLQAESSPYVQAEYLNIVHPSWVLFAFQSFFFPLTGRQIAWYRLLEQPLLTQHFALVGADKAPSAAYYQLLQILQKHFQHIDICIDASGFPLPAGWKSQERITYRLSLPENQDLLRQNYHQHLKRILKKPGTLHFRNDVAIAKFLPFLREHLGSKTQLPAHFYDKAAALLHHKDMQWQIFGAYAGDKLVAACAILHHRQQRYYQLAANAPSGKELNAMHHLVDHLLVNYCGQELVFDFEGSMIAGLQRFYGGFGAKPYIYTRVSYSRLPWPLSLWKHGIRSE